MTSDLRLYRHSATGKLQEVHPRVALAHPYLIEVPEGSKPLAYTPIPQAAIEDLRQERDEWAGPSGDAELPDEDSEVEGEADA